MSLFHVHIFFISLSILLGAGTGFRGIGLWREQGGFSQLGAEITGFSAAVILTAYLVWFVSKKRKP